LSVEEKPALGFVADAKLLRGGETSPPIKRPGDAGPFHVNAPADTRSRWPERCGAAKRERSEAEKGRRAKHIPKHLEQDRLRSQLKVILNQPWAARPAAIDAAS